MINYKQLCAELLEAYEICLGELAPSVRSRLAIGI
jgi:hypothetical protein